MLFCLLDFNRFKDANRGIRPNGYVIDLLRSVSGLKDGLAFGTDAKETKNWEGEWTVNSPSTPKKAVCATDRDGV